MNSTFKLKIVKKSENVHFYCGANIRKTGENWKFVFAAQCDCFYYVDINFVKNLIQLLSAVILILIYLPKSMQIINMIKIKDKRLAYALNLADL